MNSKAVLSFLLIGSALACASGAEEVSIKAEKAMVITFPSQTQRTYKLLGAENAAGNWTTLQDGIVGTGGEVTIFYKSESDQKLFFKVETSDGPAGQRSLLSLANLDISNKDLSGYDLEGDDLRGYSFTNSLFDGANLTAANMSEARFVEASFESANLSHAIVQGSDFKGANFQNANLEGIMFVDCNMGWADFRNANLKGVEFIETVLTAANFSGQTLTNFSFRAAGPKSPQWHKAAGLYMVDFSGANLSGADLSRNDAASMNLTNANISGVNFEGSDLTWVSFSGHDIRNVFLRGVQVLECNWSNVIANGVQMPLARVGAGWQPAGGNFQGANLEGLQAGNHDFQWAITNVSFRNANLRGANLEGLIFRNCDFTGADLAFANLIAADLSGCVGFDAEQPGVQFGGWPQNPPPAPVRPSATIMPDGTVRVGTNPGFGLAPATAPAKLHLVTNDGDVNGTQNLQLNGWTYGEGGGDAGRFAYEARGRVAVLTLNSTTTSRTSKRTLWFTSPTGGELYNSDTGGSFKIGTFSVPQE